MAGRVVHVENRVYEEAATHTESAKVRERAREARAVGSSASETDGPK